VIFLCRLPQVSGKDILFLFVVIEQEWGRETPEPCCYPIPRLWWGLVLLLEATPHKCTHQMCAWDILAEFPLWQALWTMTLLRISLFCLSFSWAFSSLLGLQVEEALLPLLPSWLLLLQPYLSLPISEAPSGISKQLGNANPINKY